MKNTRMMLSTVALGLLIYAPLAPGQMMGSHTGAMMGDGGGMGSMHDVMAWINGAELKLVPAAPEPSPDAGMFALGQRLYGDHCTVCHGAKGDGNGPRASGLSPAPRDFTKGVYKFRSTPSGALPTDEDLWKVISDGLHGTAMVPWVSLSETERWAVIAYVKDFSPRFAAEARSTPIVMTKPPATSPELVQEGGKIYNEDCALCHGPNGRGDGPAVIKDGQPLMQPRDFTSGHFQRGSDMEDIYLTLRTGLDGSPMLSFAKALTPNQTWAVAAYVRTLIFRPHRVTGAMGSTMMGGIGNQQERLGMRIDMPGMAGMHMGMGASTP
jgi:mono/diheme cytochrome c family protein